MFVFLSPQSSNSKWIHFEAGYAAGTDIQVVPVCLPGIELNQISPPLSQLQGFNLNCHEAMANLARTCNRKFGLRIDETFSAEDFEKIKREISALDFGFFGEQTHLIHHINLYCDDIVLANAGCAPIASLLRICETAGENPVVNSFVVEPSLNNHYLTEKFDFELAGCIVTHEIHGEKEPRHNIKVELSSERFKINAKLIDIWLKEMQFQAKFMVCISFTSAVSGEENRLRITSKLHSRGIHVVSPYVQDGFNFNGFIFNFGADQRSADFRYQLEGQLFDERLAHVVKQLFDTNLLWLKSPDQLSIHNAPQ
jgi:hypothetical protein